VIFKQGGNAPWIVLFLRSYRKIFYLSIFYNFALIILYVKDPHFSSFFRKRKKKNGSQKEERKTVVDFWRLTENPRVTHSVRSGFGMCDIICVDLSFEG
jgi:hypothetical protein